MTSFTELSASFIRLRKVLAAQLDCDALKEITLDPPSSNNDELSFLRLVAWSYSFIHESGRVPLAVLKQLPPWSHTGKILPHIRALRTWTSHNLSLDESSDQATLKTAYEWLANTCGTKNPKVSSQWESCFTKLCDEIYNVVSNATAACDSIDELVLEELRKRINRDWAAFKFDEIVQEVANNLGYSGIEAVAFRNNYLQDWRRVVQMSEESQIEKNLQLRMQADLLKTMNGAIPLTAPEISQLLQITDKNILVNTIITLMNASIEERNNLLNTIRS